MVIVEEAAITLTCRHLTPLSLASRISAFTAIAPAIQNLTQAIVHQQFMFISTKLHFKQF